MLHNTIAHGHMRATHTKVKLGVTDELVGREGIQLIDDGENSLEDSSAYVNTIY